MTLTLTIDRGDVGQRLDLVVRRHLTDVTAATRTRIQRWIARGAVAINGSPVRRAAARVAATHVITVTLPEAMRKRRMMPETDTLDVLNILYEDAHLLAINKPAGMVVHPTHRNVSGTTMNLLLGYAHDWPTPQRPSLVGRLDKFTSGIVLVAKTAEVHAALQRELASARTRKEYLALVYGRLRAARGTIDWHLGLDPSDRRRVVASRTVGAPSVTEFERIGPAAATKGGVSLVRCRLLTGRTHQIRVHLAAEGHPIVGDPVYNVSRVSGAGRDSQPPWARITDAALSSTLKAFPRQALHAWRLAFTHPITRAPLEIEAPLPEDLTSLFAAAGLSYS